MLHSKSVPECWRASAALSSADVAAEGATGSATACSKHHSKHVHHGYDAKTAATQSGCHSSQVCAALLNLAAEESVQHVLQHPVNTKGHACTACGATAALALCCGSGFCSWMKAALCSSAALGVFASSAHLPAASAASATAASRRAKRRRIQRSPAPDPRQGSLRVCHYRYR